MLLPRHAILLSFATTAIAQSWSITADAPSAGSAAATVFQGLPSGQNASLPVGPVAPGSLFTTSVATFGGSASSGGTWSRSVGGATTPLVFTVSANASAQVFPGAVALASANATLDLTLRSPQPVAGRLIVRMLGTAPTSVANGISLDVGADGSAEFLFDSLQPNPGTVDVPLSIPANGAIHSM